MHIRTGSSLEDLATYGTKTYVEIQDDLRVLKVDDTMTEELQMSGNLLRLLPTNKTHLSIHSCEETISWSQAAGLPQDAVSNLTDPGRATKKTMWMPRTIYGC